ncbi:MAG: CoA-binding protein [Draconibacterium sp.]|nr:CoA-binding protein [Draconibacterium sp.]
MTDKKTLVIGGSENPARYSNMAIRALRKNDVEVVSIAKRVGKVLDVEIQTNFPKDENIHTVTMYIGAQRQPEYYNQLLELKPKRVIFNPGAENDYFTEILENKGIETIVGCTLVMLSTGQF